MIAYPLILGKDDDIRMRLRSDVKKVVAFAWSLHSMAAEIRSKSGAKFLEY